MTFTKIITVSALAVVLSGCFQNADQMQVEGSAPAVAAPAGVEHQHQLPNGTFVTHTHKNGGDTSHTHTMAEITEAAEAGEYSWAFSSPEPDLEKIAWKQDDSVQEALPRLNRVKELLEDTDFSSSEKIKEAVWEYA